MKYLILKGRILSDRHVSIYSKKIVCVCVCVCVYIYIYIYIYIYTHIYTYTYIYSITYTYWFSNIPLEYCKVCAIYVATRNM
jgi:hypothetical protein